MYKKSLWKPIMAGTLALVMTLSPLVAGGAVAAEEIETTEAISEEEAASEVEAAEAAGDITLNAKNFPDAKFRKYLSENVDTDKNGILSKSERNACLNMNVELNGIVSLDGIEYFTELTTLNCNDNELESLNVTKNTKLTTLQCKNNFLTTLDLSKNTELLELYTESNRLESLNVTKNTKLKVLACTVNHLTTLNLSNNKALEHINFGQNWLPCLDLTANTNIKYFTVSTCSYFVNLNAARQYDLSQIPNFDVSKMSELSGGTISGTILTFADGMDSVTYKYDCGNSRYFETSINVLKKVESISLLYNSLTMSKGEKRGMYVTVNPTVAADRGKKWTTSDSKVATVDKNGNITAIGGGIATITCAARDGSGVSATCKVTVKSPVTKITLNKTSASVLKGKSLQLSTTIAPSDALNKEVTWKSSNTTVATVSSSGKVTAKALGTATITCTAKDGSGVKATCKITVKNPVTKIKLNKTQTGLSPKETVQLKATVTPSNASNKSVTWKTSNTKVATVTSSGKVTAKAAGTATITCTAKDGSGVKATCKITVYTNTEAFVARIYTKALNRTPEEAGLKYWTEEINSGRKTPVQVAESFFFAPEFTNKNLSDTEYVKVLYRTFMGREYDQGGLDYWLSRLAKGESRRSVLESFAGCQEFKDIVKSFGL